MFHRNTNFLQKCADLTQCERKIPSAILFSDSVIRALAAGGAAVRCERW